jgi:5'-3' exonuclease
MGIKGLRELLKKKCPSFEERVSMKDYANRKIVVDVAPFIYMYKAVLKDNYEDSFMMLFIALRENKIHATFVFDGQSPPEKANEKKKRAEKRASTLARVEKLENDLATYKHKGEISQDLNKINEKLRSSRDGGFSVRKVRQYIAKLRGNIFSVTLADFKSIKELLIVFGIPYIDASGEAEVLCASLVKRGLADAVLTTDTDVLACGVPKMLCSIDLGKQEFTRINLAVILETMQLDETSWLDLCIMCGTDFNENIPRIGPLTSFNYIKMYKNIETIGKEVVKVDKLTNEKKYLDISILNYETSRKLFQCNDVDIEALQLSTEINIEKLKDRKLPTTIKRKLGIETF